MSEYTGNLFNSIENARRDIQSQQALKEQRSYELAERRARAAIELQGLLRELAVVPDMLRRQGVEPQRSFIGRHNWQETDRAWRVTPRVDLTVAGVLRFGFRQEQQAHAKSTYNPNMSVRWSAANAQGINGGENYLLNDSTDQLEPFLESQFSPVYFGDRELRLLDNEPTDTALWVETGHYDNSYHVPLRDVLAQGVARLLEAEK